MKYNATWISLAVAGGFFFGYAVALKVNAPERPAPTAASTPLRRELAEVTTTYSQMWGETQQGLEGEAYDRARAEWREKYNQAAREVYRRHGETAPEYFRTPSTP